MARTALPWPWPWLGSQADAPTAGFEDLHWGPSQD